MKDFIKENWFKLSFAVAVILIGTSVAYYFFIYLPKKDLDKVNENNEKLFLVNQEKCQEDGMKLYNSDVREGEGITFGIPEFKFSNELNTCLYKSMYVGGRYVSQFIKDVYTNKELASWDSIMDENSKFQDLRGSKEEWDLRVKELFGY